jgi:NAD(P)-dependent dehydrogenase (short-subunit alcohol dehydrogenase family)
VPKSKYCVVFIQSQVTGAGRGLGKDVAKVLSEKGCRVVVVDINLAAVQQTAEEINETGGNAMAYKCDVSKWDDVAHLRGLVEQEVGPIDILVNNAGLIVMQSFVTNTKQDIERTVGVNVNGVLYVSKNI